MAASAQQDSQTRSPRLWRRAAPEPEIDGAPLAHLLEQAQGVPEEDVNQRPAFLRLTDCRGEGEGDIVIQGVEAIHNVTQMNVCKFERNLDNENSCNVEQGIVCKFVDSLNALSNLDGSSETTTTTTRRRRRRRRRVERDIFAPSLFRGSRQKGVRRRSKGSERDTYEWGRLQVKSARIT